MQISFVIAGLTLCTQAQKFIWKVPEAMEGQHRERWTLVDGQKVGTDALDYDAEADTYTRYCLKEAKSFDKYCHQYTIKNGKLKYGDFTLSGDSRDCSHWEDGDVTVEASYCLGQDCMFDYCLWRRDQQLAACEDFVAQWETVVDAASIEAGEDLCKKRRGDACYKTTVAVTLGDYTGK